MRAVRIHGERDLREEELALPDPGPGRVRLRMAYAGICGSDLHYFAHGANGEYVVREPLVPGHEVSGTVDADPSGELAPGTPVTVHPATFGPSADGLEDLPHLRPGGSYLGSASTWPHTQGGMSEFLVVDRSMVRVLPDGLPLRTAALAEPLAVALHAVTVAGDVAGRRVLVSGSGPIGLLVAAAALERGAGEVVATDVLPGPLERARALGVHGTVRIGEQEVQREGFDVVLECSGVPVAVSAALAAARRAAVVVQVGMVPDEPRPVNLAPLVSKELQLRGTFRFAGEIDEAVRVLAANPALERVVTHEFPLARAAEAFAVAADSEVSGKVLVSLGS
ncbi:zinc-binding dehydrogenase [Paenibacillus sp. TRM 82003]|uniref:zinc-binding dehydrogenase n=1 Tax=Kineococcus sp. TRM81007 TaxID=2925831 RepID=UPI001F5937C1|nr:zinc-binding dehydrogenase [Kineococcus sp. TRM81007]MCI2238464.1 zinc-binding dehydrogenase [Kineococcus sp. TRM81007]MCI3922022.1 zinc-binding dehydrogenase [Paenibacillus sp. TRM 82003]